MGQIIGEGITFDDVLLVPSYSGGFDHMADKEDQAEHSYDERRNGYCYRTSYGDCHG